jgi:hypothetical protein
LKTSRLALLSGKADAGLHTPFLRHIGAPILALRINIGRTVCNQSTGRSNGKGQRAFHFLFSSIFYFSFAIEENQAMANIK